MKTSKFKQYYAEKRIGDKREKMLRIEKMIAPNDLDPGNTKSKFFESTKFAHKNDSLHCLSIRYDELV